jgi:hypothetical protein
MKLLKHNGLIINAPTTDVYIQTDVFSNDDE